MKISFKIVILLFSLKSFSQEDFKDTIWFNKQWNESSKPDANFYRVYKKTPAGFLVFDKYLNGQNQMIAEASVVKPKLVINGKCYYYDASGILEKHGQSIENKDTGVWVSYFGKGSDRDSSVYEIMPDGSKKYTQRSDKQVEDIYTIVEENAEFPGGLAAMQKYLRMNVNYPANMRELSIGGKLYLKFVVDEVGDIGNVEVLVGSGIFSLDEEAVRAINAMPRWKPAKLSGRNVKCYFNLPFSFSIGAPYFIFSTNNNNENYLLAKQDLLKNNMNDALRHYLMDEKSVESKFNAAVIYYLKSSKSKSKKYFEEVKLASSDRNSQFYILSDRFLTNYFN